MWKEFGHLDSPSLSQENLGYRHCEHIKGRPPGLFQSDLTFGRIVQSPISLQVAGFNGAWMSLIFWFGFSYTADSLGKQVPEDLQQKLEDLFDVRLGFSSSQVCGWLYSESGVDQGLSLSTNFSIGGSFFRKQCFTIFGACLCSRC